MSSQQKRLTKAQRINALLRNGITPEDLSARYKEGYEEGFQQAAPRATKMIYAAIALALKKELHFGRRRIKRMLTAVDALMLDYLTSEEIIDAVWQDVGLALKFEDPTEPIQEIDDDFSVGQGALTE